jgi:uncharacterized membrane protein
LTARLPRPAVEPARGSNRRAVLRALALLPTPLIVGYPVLVYYSMQHYSARAVSVVLLIGLGPFLWRLTRGGGSVAKGGRQSAQDEDSRTRLHWLLPLLALGLLSGAVFFDSAQALLLIPVCINGALLLSFGVTLRTERPLIERFARLQHADLTHSEVRWCRLWTIIWMLFFGFNITLASVLTVARSVEWWAYYNGLISYLVMGMLFTTEYLVRKYRFQRFGRHRLDRVLRWCFIKTGLLQ